MASRCIVGVTKLVKYVLRRALLWPDDMTSMKDFVLKELSLAYI